MRQPGSGRGASGATRASNRAPSDSGVWKSTDAGRTWTDANRGLPPAPGARPNRPRRRRLEPEGSLCVRRQLRGRPPRAAKASATRMAARSLEARIKASRDLSQRRPRRDVAQGQREQRVHERTLGDLWLGVRPDSRRSDRREHDLHPRHRPQRVPRCRQDVHAAARHARRPSRALDRSREAGDALQRERRRLLPVRRCGQVLELRARGRRRAVLQRDARLEHARVGLWVDSGRWQPARPDRSERRPRQDPRRRIRQRSRGRGLASRHRSRRSQHRLLARVLRELHALERRAGAAASRRRVGGRSRDAAARARRTRTRRGNQHPAVVARRRAAGAVDGADHHVDARAGRDLRRIPVRLSLGKSRRVVGADQSGPDVERPVPHAAAEQQRDPVPDDHGARRIAAPARPPLRGNRRRQAARDARTTARPGRS